MDGEIGWAETRCVLEMKESKVLTYSFCASMMISVLSLTLAVDGGMPTRARKVLTSVAVDMLMLGGL